MSTRATLAGIFVLWAVITAFGACNQEGDCPAKGTVMPGGSCTSDALQCAYDLQTPSPACDGTSTTIASSCTCTSGAWACPSPLSCGDGGSTEPGPDSGTAGGDSSTPPGDDAGDSAPPRDAGAVEDALTDGPRDGSASD